MAQERTPRYLALDPGETTGWATFDDEGVVIKYGQVKQEDLHQWLDAAITSNLRAVISEEYRIYSSRRQRQWSRNQTSKNEGAIEVLCSVRGVPFHLQPANIKKIGYMWAGLGAAPNNHSISHQFDAVAHGTYWLRSKGILKPTIPGE
jgi:hypothetical protein